MLSRSTFQMQHFPALKIAASIFFSNQIRLRVMNYWHIYTHITSLACIVKETTKDGTEQMNLDYRSNLIDEKVSSATFTIESKLIRPIWCMHFILTYTIWIYANFLYASTFPNTQTHTHTITFMHDIAHAKWLVLMVFSNKSARKFW